MTPNESTSGMKTAPTNALGGVRAASTIVLLAGIWFFVSPWVYGAYTSSNAWNSWIIGAVIFILGCIRAARPAYSTVLSWCNTVLGIWAFCSPWIYGYTGNTGRSTNSLCVGVIVFVFSIASARLASKRTTIPVPRS
jgi:uncharacterized membrane protein